MCHRQTERRRKLRHDLPAAEHAAIDRRPADIDHHCRAAAEFHGGNNVKAEGFGNHMPGLPANLLGDHGQISRQRLNLDDPFLRFLFRFHGTNIAKLKQEGFILWGDHLQFHDAIAC